MTRLEQLLTNFISRCSRRSANTCRKERRVKSRALASDQVLVLLDGALGVDPFGRRDQGNDPRSGQRHIGVLITDHNVRETLDICDRAYIVNEGHIIADGNTEAILSNEKVRNVYLGAQFRL
jgi:lipopolysaccharide export system ATP-binding protein